MKITIVTVVYNAEKLVEKTIQSVINQSYFPNIEYIVIDGNSSDGTKAILERYRPYFAAYLSEKDKGIYDAMNKGIALATGEYLNFMNAGDEFASNTVVEELFKACKADTELLYGDHQVVYPNFVKNKVAAPVEEMYKFMIFSHQSLFVKTQLLKEQPFDLQYKIAADFHFAYNQFMDKRRFQHVPLVVVRYASGGKSEQKTILGYREAYKIVQTRDKSKKTRKYHSYKILKQYPIEWLRKILPESWFLGLMKAKNKMMGK